jgi:hypothetical protein
VVDVRTTTVPPAFSLCSDPAMSFVGPRRKLDVGLTTAEREELTRLGRENRKLKEEREVLASRVQLYLARVDVSACRTIARAATPGPYGRE